jgi:hypothetical protein
MSSDSRNQRNHRNQFPSSRLYARTWRVICKHHSVGSVPSVNGAERAAKLQRLLAIPGVKLAINMEGERDD